MYIYICMYKYIYTHFIQKNYIKIKVMKRSSENLENFISNSAQCLHVQSLSGIKDKFMGSFLQDLALLKQIVTLKRISSYLFNTYSSFPCLELYLWHTTQALLQKFINFILG